MTYIARGVSHGNSAVDTPSDRESTLSVFRTAAARCRLTVNALETIGTALRNKQINIADAMVWARDENLLSHLDLVPPSRKAGGK